MLEDSYSKIISHLATEWAGTTDIAHGNTHEVLTPPYIRATILPVSNEQVELGANGRDRFDALLRLEAFTKLDKGEGDGLRLLDQLKTIFQRGTTLTTTGSRTIRFFTPIPLVSGEDGKGFYRVGIDCRWYMFHKES